MINSSVEWVHSSKSSLWIKYGYFSFVCIIFLLCVVVAILFKELRKEKAAHNKTKNDVEEAKTNNNDLNVEYKDEQ